MTTEERSDVVSHAEQAIHGALLDLLQAVQDVETPMAAQELQQRITGVTASAIFLEKLALDRADTLCGRTPCL